MPDDINDLDVTDAGLKGIFGDRFHDETAPAMARPKKVYTNTTKTEKVAEKPKDKPVEAQWEPVKEPNWMDNLKACAIWAIGFGSLTLLFFAWQQAGLMDASVAVPTMCVCTAMGGWGVGKNAVRGKR
jgi:hypothetical protein